MVGGVSYRGRIVDHFAGGEILGERGRQEDEVEADVRVPGGEGETLVVAETAVSVDIAAVEHDLDRLVTNAAAGDPRDEPEPGRKTPEVKRFARGKGIEIAGEHVKAVLMMLDAFEQGLKLAFAEAFGEVRMDRAEVNAEDSYVGESYLYVGPPKGRGLVPLVVFDR